MKERKDGNEEIRRSRSKVLNTWGLTEKEITRII